MFKVGGSLCNSRNYITVFSKIVYEFISRFGTPLDLHSDQGSNYQSELFREVCKPLDINKTRTSPYHPSANGMVERFNRTLLSMMAVFVDDNQTYWDVHLPLLTSAYRSCTHESTQLTPKMVMVGREVHLPIQLTLGGVPGDTDIPDVPEYVFSLKQRMVKIYDFVRSYTNKSIQRQKKDYDTRIAVNTYKVGDLVYSLDSTKNVGRSPKLTSALWNGPLIVTRKLSQLLFEVKGPPKTKPNVLHHDRLKPYLSKVIPDWVPQIRNKVTQSDTKIITTGVSASKEVTEDQDKLFQRLLKHKTVRLMHVRN